MLNLNLQGRYHGKQTEVAGRKYLFRDEITARIDLQSVRQIITEHQLVEIYMDFEIEHTQTVGKSLQNCHRISNIFIASHPFRWAFTERQGCLSVGSILLGTLVG
ncbi:MAG: hypothetical protein MUO29_04960 [Desulfobacterales bacterium]|nr:hypothetical protein [Desulfobacterales bacterium]